MTRLPKKQWGIILGVAILFGIGFWSSSFHHAAAPANVSVKGDYSDGKIELEGQTIKIQTAVTQAERELGLGGRDSIGEDQGMLFLFDTIDDHAFWMKGMKFSIDIVWLKDNKIVDLAPNVPNVPDARSDADYPVYKPKTDANEVLELKAGWAERHNMKIGDEITVYRNE